MNITLIYGVLLWKACALSGYILGVNPFNQPGVEAYKKYVCSFKRVWKKEKRIRKKIKQLIKV